jgi:hypothetical protein
MSKMKRYLLLASLLLLRSYVTLAQWQPDVRLTNAPGESWTTNNNARSIASNGDVLHVVWWDYRDGNWEIYYKRSTDGGISWGNDTRLTNNFASSENPSVSVSGSIVHIVWSDDREGQFVNHELYYKRSIDGGVSWGPDTRLTNAPFDSYSPSVELSGQVLHVVWDDKRDGNDEIYYKRSTDGGVNWGADTRLTNDAAFSWFPSVSVSGQVVHVVWYDFRDDPTGEIYYKRSTDGGVSWGADTRLTNNSSTSWFPSVSVSGSFVHVVWHDYRDGNSEIYYKRSTDGGTSWGADTRLTNNPAFSEISSISASGSAVHVAWHDSRDGSFEIYYKLSTDGGTSWGADTRLTNNITDSEFPSIAISGSVVNIVWTDYRDTDTEIYYKRNPTGNPVGLIINNSETPDEFFLSQNYPNPFNPKTKIRFSLPRNSVGQTFLSVYDILGREVQTLVNEQLNPGTYEVEWDASKFSSGVYYYKIVDGDYTDTKKMILIK